MTSNFYRAFEDKHRGNRALIKTRLGVYLPFLNMLSGLLPGFRVLDLGCGRGEWLELLRDNGIPAFGVDLDRSMLTACAESGLDVLEGDALEYLQALPDHSLLAVSGFHIAEHLEFPQLQALFVEALRVLHPEGILILETPNPENLLVGAAYFYLDPTHKRPLPMQLLVFLAEYYGYASCKILRLQELSRLTEGGEAALYDVLGGASPDYAIVARASAGSTQMPGWETPCGLSLYDLADRYDRQLSHRWSAQVKAQENLSEQIAMALSLAQQNATQLDNILTSRSWRLARLLRSFVNFTRSFSNWLKNL